MACDIFHFAMEVIGAFKRQKKSFIFGELGIPFQVNKMLFSKGLF